MVVALLIIIVGTNIYHFSQVERHLQRVVGTHNVQMAIMNDVLDLARQRSLTLQHMLLAEDPFSLDRHLIRMGEIAENYHVLRKTLAQFPATPAEKQVLDAQHEQTTHTGTMQGEVIRLISDGHFGEAKTLFYRDAMPSQVKAMGLMHKFVALQHEQNKLELENTTRDINTERNKSLWLLFIGLIFSTGVAIWIANKLDSEIKRRNLVENDLENRVEQRTEELKHMACHDTLTCLPNRAVSAVRLQDAINSAKRSGNKVALFFMDLDGFKAINDQFGHATGDKVLMDITQRLQEAVRGEDMLARVGGDEFTLILGGIEKREHVVPIAEKIIQSINQPLVVDGQTCKVGISIGVAYYPDDAENPEDLLTSADVAMYRAKRSGKNRLAGI